MQLSSLKKITSIFVKLLSLNACVLRDISTQAFRLSPYPMRYQCDRQVALVAHWIVLERSRSRPIS